MRSLSQSMAACFEDVAIDGSFVDLFGRLCRGFYLSQIALGLKCCHTTHASSGYGLAEHFILDVAGGKDAGYGGAGGIRFGDQIARRLHLQLALEEPGCRFVTDGDEHTLDRQL